MSLRLKLPLHGRSHLPNGSDPIPGGFLHWGVNTDTESLGLNLHSQGNVNTDTTGGFFRIATNGGTMQFDSTGTGGVTSFQAEGWTVNSFNGQSIELTADGSGARVLITSNDDDVVVQIGGTGQMFEVIGSGGSTFQVRDDGTVHIKTGQTFIADL